MTPLYHSKPCNATSRYDNSLLFCLLPPSCRPLKTNDNGMKMTLKIPTRKSPFIIHRETPSRSLKSARITKRYSVMPKLKNAWPWMVLNCAYYGITRVSVSTPATSNTHPPKLRWTHIAKCVVKISTGPRELHIFNIPLISLFLYWPKTSMVPPKFLLYILGRTPSSNHSRKQITTQTKQPTKIVISWPLHTFLFYIQSFTNHWTFPINKEY